LSADVNQDHKTMRCAIFIAIAGLASAALAADEPSNWLTDRLDRSPLPALYADSRFHNDVAPADSGFRPDATPVLPSAFSLYDEPAPEGEVETAERSEADNELVRSYRSPCDCDCTIPSLDHWCVYDVTHCGGYCTDHPCDCAHGTCRLTESGQWVCNDGCCDVWGAPVYGSNSAVRFGWWGVSSDGSEVKTGEFQDLDSSPFWDIDTISSDGVRTWDIILSGLDNEANDARIRYYGPGLTGKFDFQRYLRRWEHDPLNGLDLAPGQVPPPGPEGNVIVDDLNLGEDYAIRVQEFDAKFQGRLMDNVKWRLNFWSQRKFGERQANASAHCFNVLAPAPAGATGNVCHVLSQRQAIDWTTVELQPALEARFQNVAVEYSRTMRGFGQDDESVFREYTRTPFSPANAALGPPFQYALVPDNFTQIDRLKVNARVTEHNQLYANLFVGDTKNKFREMHRGFGGYDLRLINSSIEQTKITAYTSWYDEDNELPGVILDAPPLAPEGFEETRLRHPVDYTRTRAGVKTSWQPFGDRGPRYTNYGLWEGTTLASGYEYYLLERDNSVYPSRAGFDFVQPDTKSHQIEFGPSTKWSRSFDTFTRYKVRFIEDPLLGFRPNSGDFNTSQPEQVHATEIGGTWAPATNFATTAQISFINSWHDSEFADFSEDSYPMVFTLWYAPTHRLSFTGGYAYFSNWIDQDITLGATLPTVPVPPLRTETTRWSYEGTNHLFNINANYAWTKNVQLLAGFEWNRGVNAFDVPASPAGADWSLLPLLADVIVETARVTTGIEWQPYHDMNVYLRYIYFDWNDIGADLYSGTAHMALLGATRVW
jgi:hypothetical protein